MALAANKKIKSVNRWSPNPAPVGPEQLPDYLFSELNKLGDVVFNLDTFRLESTHVAPSKSRDGDIRYADGTDWNPSGGEGIYAFFNDTWNKLQERLL